MAHRLPLLPGRNDHEGNRPDPRNLRIPGLPAPRPGTRPPARAPRPRTELLRYIPVTDVIALLAISQLVCLGAIFYLYMQLQSVKSGAPARKRHASPRVHQMPAPAIGQAANARAARAAYGAGPNP